MDFRRKTERTGDKRESPEITQTDSMEKNHTVRKGEV